MGKACIALFLAFGFGFGFRFGLGLGIDFVLELNVSQSLEEYGVKKYLGIQMPPGFVNLTSTYMLVTYIKPVPHLTLTAERIHLLRKVASHEDIHQRIAADFLFLAAQSLTEWLPCSTFSIIAIVSPL
jgi:hypothetical protein